MIYTVVGLNALDPERVVIRYQEEAYNPRLALKKGIGLAYDWNDSQTQTKQKVHWLRCEGETLRVSGGDKAQPSVLEGL